jgi:hypothetical protein
MQPPPAFQVIAHSHELGGRHAQGEQVSKRIDRQMDLAVFPTFGAVIAARASLSGVDCKVRLSRIAAVGLSLRPNISFSARQ